MSQLGKKLLALNCSGIVMDQTTQLPSRTRNSIPQSDVQKQSFHLLSLKLMN